MKKIIIACAIVLGFTSFGFLTSCQKAFNNNLGDDTVKTPNPTRGNFTCMINGIAFESEFRTAKIVTDISGIKSLQVDARQYGSTRQTNDFKLVVLNISPYEGPKNYELNSNVFVSYTVFNKDNTNNFYSQVVSDTLARLNITEDGANVTGTFNFKVQEAGNTDGAKVQQLSNGVFSMPRI